MRFYYYIEEFLQDLTIIRLLAEKTKDLLEVAYNNAMEGRVGSLATLLVVAAEKVISLLTIRGEGGVSSRGETTVYECVLRSAMSLGRPTGAIPHFPANSDEKRKVMLREMELLQLFGGMDRGRHTDRRVTQLLLTASQARDDEVLEVMLMTSIDVNETDGDGNSALHWFLRGSSGSQDLRVAKLLLGHGARVSRRNRLGQTPIHVAAANGNLQALEILLAHDRDCVNIPSETKETALFLAVKNDFKECAQLLLQYGANPQVLNLRNQRPIDLAKSQDMRFLLSPMNLGFGYRTIPTPEVAPDWANNDDSIREICTRFLNSKEEVNASERSWSNAKMELCKYYESPSGCVRGAKCYFAHGEEELRRTNSGPWDVKQGATVRHVSKLQRMPDDLNRKIFIGGLPPSVDSDSLGDIFEKLFGPIEGARVIGSQTGEHTQSRGFGFITFKHEQSVTAAVEAHYVTVLDKKVEIKSAVPKVVLAEFNKPPRQQLRQKEQQELKTDEKEADHGKPEQLSLVESILSGHYKTGGLEPAIGSSETSLPSWVPMFAKWLPRFLLGASKRLKDGEWYPLSSLKGDFRATCGMELDHTSLGYLKLSDFMRSFQGLCRMKVIPVGKGPATHMVLLPNLPAPPSHSDHFIPLGDEIHVYKYQHSSDNVVRVTMDPPPPPVNLQAFTATNSVSGENDNRFTASTDSGNDWTVPRRLLSFCQRDTSFLRPWYLPPESDKERGTQSLSLFACQFDYHKNMRENAISGACQLCNQRRALWLNLLCGHKVLCDYCKTHRPAPATCTKCHQNVQVLRHEPWDKPRTESLEHSPASSSASKSPIYEGSPSSVGSIEGNSSKIKCLVCKEREAVWANFPCGHKVLCSACKSGQKASGTCLLCRSPVKNRIALQEESHSPLSS
ncbi:serine/threonine-protein phosphatase 6 regulatory ankyrin repeat subunit [Tasmannia lanceolata]|uniref:serine/threonine-protein phosphatase 6 regulatory ankyrin repeat subunit n=1 Tax=Tasmannia lanceolata TaxID=3420 RepID=UPI004063C3CC